MTEPAEVGQLRIWISHVHIPDRLSSMFVITKINYDTESVVLKRLKSGVIETVTKSILYTYTSTNIEYWTKQ